LQGKNDSLRKQLMENGYKLTTQRQAVIDCLTRHEGEHLSPEEIYQSVKIDNPDIGLATIYRTLSLFSDMKLVNKLNFDDGFYRYELNDKRMLHKHHHLICLMCGDVIEVQDDLLESIEREILRKNGFIVKDHRVKFYGYCKKCSDIE
jgi:Fur family ferric uptake transcriptional regulator